MAKKKRRIVKRNPPSPGIRRTGKPVKRIVSFRRKTKETDISITMNLDGTGKYNIKTPEPFLSHMLEQLSKHSKIDIKINAKGDTEIDAHHLTEDTGIVMGQALVRALGKKRGIKRFGAAGVLDDALCRIVLDLSGRPYLDLNLKLKTKRIGSFDTELVEEFFEGLVREGKITMHVDQLKGRNTHHILESVFKGLALALKEAVKIDGKGVSSTKGRL